MSDGSVIYEARVDSSKVDGDLNSANAKVSSGAGNFGSAMKKAAVAIGAALAAAGTAVVKMGMDFEAQMSRVQAISGATAGELEKLEEQALELGASTVFSATEAAEGMENLASAGFAVNEIMGAMPGLLDLAAVSGGDVAAAAEVAASTIRAFGLDASEAGHVADVFARAAADTNAEVGDMGEAMKYIAPVAKAMGLSMEETAAAVGIMSDAGVKGSQAGTTLRGALSRLAKPTKPVLEAMEKLGVSFYDAQGNMISLEGQVGVLQKAFVGLTQQERNHALVSLYGQESLSGMLALIEAGPEKLFTLTNSLENCDGAAADMADTMLDNLKGAVEGVSGQLETIALRIYKDLEEPLKDAVGVFADFLDALSKTGMLDQLTEALGGLAKILSETLVQIMPVLIRFLGAIVPPLAEIISTILPPLIELFSAFLEPLLDLVKMVMPVLIDLLEAVIPPFVELAEVIFPVLAEILKALLGPLIELIQMVLPYMVKYLEIVVAFWAELADAVMPIVLELFDKLLPVLFRIADAILPVMISAFEMLLPPLLELAETLLPILLKLFDALIVPLLDLVEKLLPVLLPLFEDIVSIIAEIIEVLSPLIELFAELILQMAERLMPVITLLAEVFTDLLGGAIGSVMDILGVFLDILKGVLDFLVGVFTGDWERAWGGIVDIFKGIVNLIPTVLEAVVNGAIGLINGLIKGINSISSKLGLGEIRLINEVSLPRLRVGMDYVPADDFPALLHRGEMVLTAGEAAAYRAEQSASTPGATQNSSSMNIGSLTINPNAEQWAQVMDLLQQAGSATQHERAGYRDGTI